MFEEMFVCNFLFEGMDLGNKDRVAKLMIIGVVLMMAVIDKMMMLAIMIMIEMIQLIVEMMTGVMTLMMMVMITMVVMMTDEESTMLITFGILRYEKQLVEL